MGKGENAKHFLSPNNSKADDRLRLTGIMSYEKANEIVGYQIDQTGFKLDQTIQGQTTDSRS